MSRVDSPTRAELTSKARARKRKRRNVTIGTIVTVALCAAGGGIAFAATRSGSTDYRTVAASSGTVTETVDLTGTVASASRKDAAFETAGTVKSVAVKVGDAVTAGQTLATLKNSSLDAAITSADQSVTAAEETLASDLSSESSTSSSSDSSSAKKSGGTGTGGGTGGGSGSGGGTGATESAAVKAAIANVTSAQTALIAGYKTASDSATATDALVTASSPTCAPFVAATVSDSNVTESDGSTETPAHQVTAAQAALAGCKTAISGVLTSEQATDADQAQVKVLATDLNTAVAALQTALAASGYSASTTSAMTGDATPTVVLAAAVTTTGGASSGGGTSSDSTTITAATILSDEAAITAAKAQVAIAKNAKTLGALTSPISGTVAAVSITSGSSVSAGSATEVITVIGDDGYVISSTTTLTGVEELKIGDAVAITVPSRSKPLAGTVSSIGILNESTSTTPSYDVTVAVTDTNVSILNGASASMIVTADVAKSVLTVPTSAIHRASRTYTVDVLKDGKEVATKVSVGASGTELTQITSGISAGDMIILADVSSTTIGDSTSTTTTSSSGGLSGLGGSITGTSGGGTGTGGPPSGGFGGNN
jgi:multidrug efflux pump subunit AcrA (membrane-fusion protein)